MDITQPPGHGYLSEIRFWAQENMWKKVSPAYCLTEDQGSKMIGKY